MSDTDDIQTAKKAVDTAKEATSKINDWAKEANELAEAGKDLNKIQGVLKDVSAFGKASAALGAAGVGLDLVLTIMGGPTPEEQIMAMITELSGKVDRLSTHVDHQFTRKTHHDNRVNAHNLTLEHMDAIHDVQADIDAWRAETDPTVKKSKLNTLLKPVNDPDVLHNHVRDLATRLAANTSDENLLRAVYEDTFGGMGQVSSVGMAVLARVVYAPMAYGILTALRHQADPDNTVQLNAQQIADMFNPEIDKISAAITAQCQQCLDNATANIDERMSESDLFETLDVSDLGAASIVLGQVLLGTYYWLDWAIIVFAPVTGWAEDGSIGGKNRREMLRKPCANDKKASFVISWGDPIPPNEDKMQDFRDFVVKSLKPMVSNIPFMDLRAPLKLFEQEFFLFGRRFGDALLVLLIDGTECHYVIKSSGGSIKHQTGDESGDVHIRNYQHFFVRQ